MKEENIRYIYKEFYKGKIVPVPIQGKNSESLETYKNNPEYYLYVDEADKYFVVTEETMHNLYDEGKLFHSGMFKNDYEYQKYEAQNDIIKNYVTFKTYCIHNEIEALQKLGINEDDIVKIIQSRWGNR